MCVCARQVPWYALFQLRLRDGANSNEAKQAANRRRRLSWPPVPYLHGSCEALRGVQRAHQGTTGGRQRKGVPSLRAAAGSPGSRKSGSHPFTGSPVGDHRLQLTASPRCWAPS